MTRTTEFHREASERWAAGLEQIGLSTTTTNRTWDGPSAIRHALAPLIQRATNHAHYPTGGGLDWEALGSTHEPDCLAVHVDDRMVDVFRPERMTVEHFPNEVQESFALIELGALDPANNQEPYRGLQQEFLELPGRGYVDRSIWDRNYIDLDENEREIPIPSDARLVSRWLGGKILLVAKGSIWNGNPGTYDGRHNDMMAAQIRAQIERVLADRTA